MPASPVAPAPRLFIVLNAGSGHDDTAATRTIIESVLSASGRAYELVVVDEPSQLPAIARQTVERAQRCGGVVVAAGGDGTINTVAQAALGSGCPFGVLPRGTFNYFGREHGIPDDTADATRALLTGAPQPVQVGLVNERVFLVNASLGLYPRLLEDREAWKAQFGRSRLVAFMAGLVSVLRNQRQLRISLEEGGSSRSIRTPTMFVGNNRLQLHQIGIPLADAVGGGLLAAITVRPVGTLTMLWLLLRGAFGQLGEANSVFACTFAQLTVRRPAFLRSRLIKVATDGEVAWLSEPLEFRVSPQPLLLLKPAPAFASAASAGP